MFRFKRCWRFYYVIVVAIAQVLIVTCGRVVGFVIYLFVIIDPNCSVNVGVKLQGGDGGAVVEMLYLLLVGHEVGVGLLVPGGWRGRGRGGVECTTLFVEVFTYFAWLKC